ncbi:MAG TPA: hypothetical protein VGE02_11790 [Gemmatimonadales bacterium]
MEREALLTDVTDRAKETVAAARAILGQVVLTGRFGVSSAPNGAQDLNPIPSAELTAGLVHISYFDRPIVLQMIVARVTNALI